VQQMANLAGRRFIHSHKCREADQRTRTSVGIVIIAIISLLVRKFPGNGILDLTIDRYHSAE
jgi:hypothetical protein